MQNASSLSGVSMASVHAMSCLLRVVSLWFWSEKFFPSCLVSRDRVHIHGLGFRLSVFVQSKDDRLGAWIHFSLVSVPGVLHNLLICSVL